MSKEYRFDESVPKEGRHYRFLDMVGTWMGANAHPASWFVGGSIAACGMTSVFSINFLGNIPVYLIMIALGYVGYKIGSSSPGLFRATFGVRGSHAVTVISAVTLLGWVSNGIFLAAISISYIMNTMFGTPAYGMEGSNPIMLVSIIVMAVLSALAIAISGTKSMKIIQNVLVVLLVILTIWVTVVVLQTYSLSDIIAWQPPEDQRMPYGMGVNTVAAYSFGFALILADYTRFTKKASSATVAPFVGAMASVVWFIFVGAIGTIGVAMTSGVFDPNMSDPSSVIAGLGLGAVALFVIITSVLTTNTVNLYSGTIAINSITEKAKFLPTLVVFTVLSILLGMVPIYLSTFIDFFYSFMHVLGALYPPIAAAMIMDYYFVRKKSYDITQFGKKDGLYWYSNGINWSAIVTLILGTALYLGLEAISFGANSIGVAIPNFVFSCIIYLVATKILRTDKIKATA